MFMYDVFVQFSDCDGLGHVNNAKYFNYLESARVDIFKIFNPSLELNKWNLIVASARCDFLSQVGYAEHLKVYSWISRIGTSSFVVDQAVKNENGTWVARGQATLIGFNFETQTASPLSDDVRKTLAAHTQAPDDVPPIRG